MKTVELAKRSPDLEALLDQARVEDVVVRLEDGTEFLVTAVDDFDLEIAAQIRNERLMALLDDRVQQSGALPLDEVKRRFGLIDRTGEPGETGDQTQGT